MVDRLPVFEKALGSVGKTLKIIPWSDAGFDGYGYSVFASDKAIAGKADALRRFARAYVKAAKMALADPDDVARSMKATFPEMDQALIKAQFLTLVPLMNNAIAKKEGFGTLDNARLATTWDWTARAQNMPKDKIDPETAVDRAFVPK